MLRPPARLAGTLAALCAALALAGGSGARASASAASAQRDTTLVTAAGDRIEVSVRPMIRPGIELCAANGPGVRGTKSVLAVNDARTAGVGLPTTVRFPGAGTTPRCETHRHLHGDSIGFDFVRQVRHPTRGVARLWVGSFRFPLERARRKRITFRWVGVGADSIPPGAYGPSGEEPR